MLQILQNAFEISEKCNKLLCLSLEEKQISMKYFLFDNKCILYQIQETMILPRMQTNASDRKLPLSISIKRGLFTGKTSIIRYITQEKNRNPERKWHKCILKNDTFFLQY